MPGYTDEQRLPDRYLHDGPWVERTMGSHFGRDGPFRTGGSSDGGTHRRRFLPKGASSPVPPVVKTAASTIRGRMSGAT